MPPKKPFGANAYKDNRSTADKAKERAEVVKQANSLKVRAGDNNHRRTTTSKIQNRRAAGGAVPIEGVPRPNNKLDVVVAARRLLIKAADLTPAVAAALQQRGIVEAARTGAIVRLTVPAAAAPAGIAALAGTLRQQSIAVSLDHVTPLGVWMKGDGGPERTAGTRPFPAAPPNPGAPMVAVIDTGISNLHRNDGYLGANIAPADADPRDTFPAPNGDGLLDAVAGHGSFVAGIVQQVAPLSKVGSYKAVDGDGVTTSFEVAATMRLAVQQGATILNLSLGTDTEDGLPPIAFKDVVDELALTHPNVLIVCAAGNGASTDPVWPAALAATSSNVVAVAALDPSGAPAAWSSHGAWVTCSAIGEGVVSTYVEGTEDGALIGDPQPDTFPGPNPWAVWTGTSFTAPQIAGAVARICTENVGVTPPQALDMLKNLPTPATTSAGYGWTVEILPGTGN